MSKNAIQYWLDRYDKGDELKAVCRLIQLESDKVMSVCRTDATSRRVAKRVRSARLMAELGHPASPYIIERMDLLKTMLARDPSRAVRREAATSLAVIARPASFEVLKNYASDNDPLVRQAILLYLYKIGNGSAWRILSDLARDPDSRVREMAACTLGLWTPTPRQKPDRIVRSMLGDSNRNVRSEAIRAALLQGDFAAVPHLLKELERLAVPTELVYAVLELAIKAEETTGREVVLQEAQQSIRG